MVRTLPSILFMATLCACASTTPERRAVEAAASALGGIERVTALSALVLEGEGTQWNVGQDMTIDSTSQTFSITGYHRAIDLEAGRMQVQQTLTPNFLYYQGQDPRPQTYGLDGEIAYTVRANGAAARASADNARERFVEMYHHPVVLVRAALGQDATLSNLRTEGTEQLIDIELPGGGPFTMAMDAASYRPTRIQSLTAHPNLGDTVIETRFEDYMDVSGLQLPERLVTMTDRFKALELRLSRPSLDVDRDDLVAPEGARAAALPEPPAISVSAEAVADGVWLLAGQSHHSALVEFQDYLMLIEAPHSEARTRAVIERARELVPGKPLTVLVSTHFHFDHSAGLRAAVAEGLKVLVHESDVAYFEEATTRPHTLEPDELARNPRALDIEGVGDSRVIEDGTRRVELYHIAGNPHGDTLLMAYLPRERILVQVDAFGPGSAVHPYAPNLLENIRSRNLRVDRIVPLHGIVVPFTDLVKAVQPS